MMPCAALIHEQFDRQALQSGPRIALRDHDRSVTYAELRTLSQRIAAALTAAGVPDGACVGLHMERSVEYVASVLAVLRMNGAVLPLPPSYPAARLREIVSFAAVDAVIDAPGTRLRGGIVAGHFDVAALLRHDHGPSADRRSDPDQPAFVLSSSGSTGTPKLIVRSHRSFFHRLEWTWTRHPFAADDVCCQKSALTTTHSVYELFEPLLRGAPLVLIADRDVRDLERFWETLRAHAVTRLLIVPSMLQASLDMPAFEPPPLRTLVLMGEYVHPRLAARAVERMPAHTAIYSIYGSTEASSTLVCDLRAAMSGLELPLGRPIADDIRALALDDDGVPVPPGAVGVLHIAGPALFTEYRGDAQLTAQTCARRNTDHGRLYDTRDRVRLAADGQLYYAGRVDHVVKMRGFRVDVQEVEHAIAAHEAVAHVAVIAQEDDEGGPAQRLIAFVTPAHIDASEVLRAAAERLPAYMLPSRVVCRAALPRTASGKLDRTRLLEELERPPHAAAVTQLTETEQRVAAVFTDVIGAHHPVANDRSFFELGGTSLTVFVALHRLRMTFALDRGDLNEDTFRDLASVRRIAAHIDAIGDHPGIVATPASDAIAVALKEGRDAALAPLFLFASAGGTVGSYTKLVAALRTNRAVFGLRDPYLTGRRELDMTFDDLVNVYLQAIRTRQPAGPYYLAAYSSGSAPAWEAARRLREQGEEVACLALIDPIAMDSVARTHFGYWALRSRFAPTGVAALVRCAGALRRWLPRSRRSAAVFTPDRVYLERHARLLIDATVPDSSHILVLSALLELNTGLPLTLERGQLDGLPADQYLPRLLARIADVAPEIDRRMIERIAAQYRMQTGAQHLYEVRRYDGPLLLLEVRDRFGGLVAAQLRPYVRRLRAGLLELGEESERSRHVCDVFARGVRNHYRCMRDDTFVQQVAAELETALHEPARDPGCRSPATITQRDPTRHEFATPAPL